MPRRLRHIPEPGSLVEVTCRTFQGRCLLRPSPQLNQIIIGALSRGQQRYGVQVCAPAYMSNHAHLLLIVDDARQLARFMGFVNSKISREIGRLLGWREKVWGKRYDATLVSQEPEAQISRLRYILSQGVKEHLVDRCRDWPGVHPAHPLCTGEAMRGFWLDRVGLYRARSRTAVGAEHSFLEPESLALAPIPCWEHLDPDSYRSLVSDLVAQVEEEASSERRRRKIRVLGPRAILQLDPTTRIELVPRPAPLVHSASRDVARLFRAAYAEFVRAYRAARERLLRGEPHPAFPPGCFPSALPFTHPVPSRADP